MQARWNQEIRENLEWLRHYCAEFVSVIKPPCFYSGDFTRERIIQTRGIKHVKLKVRNIHKKKVDSVCARACVCVRVRVWVKSSYHRASWGKKLILNYLQFWLGNTLNSTMIGDFFIGQRWCLRQIQWLQTIFLAKRNKWKVRIN
jgi:hypothetical protein